MTRCLVRLPNEEMALVVVSEKTTFQDFLNDVSSALATVDLPRLHTSATRVCGAANACSILR